MIHVTAGIIESNNKVLIARRKEGKHLAGFWEFPGGKIEDGESPEECLKRELLEELSLEVLVGAFFMINTHKYGDKTILLKSYKCEIISGEITLNDHDAIKWVTITELKDYKFAPADIPFVNALINENKYNRTVYSIKSFLEVEVSTWGERLKEHVFECMGEEASISQRRAWFNSFITLKDQLMSSSISQEAKIVFEYELPRERGRRPDVLILSGDNLLVLEFKGYANENKAQIDQAKHYARDLANYHEKSHQLTIIPFLVLESAKNTNKVIDEVHIISGDKISEALAEYVNKDFSNMREWYFGEYAPLPSLIQAAQLIYSKNEFPQIKKAHSAGIPETLRELNKIVLNAKQNNSHHLVLISGVPGAGKTLVGIQFVFETYLQEIEQKAVLLSGNGPLVKVLQSSLRNNNFVQAVHGYLKDYAHSAVIPSEDIIIYDEAQRAWDSEKVEQSRRVGSNSEPTDFVNIADRKEHCIIVGLIGDGQEIHIGEESGVSLWSEAINNSKNNWHIHCPKKFITHFNTLEIEANEKFNLTTSLRTHQALALQSWVTDLLENDTKSLLQSFKRLIDEDYALYITRDLEIAKNYLKQKYSNEPDKTFGLIASSKGKSLPKYGVMNDFNSTKSFTPSQYYVEKDSPSFCRNFRTVVTEFACQGLELDMPILAWDNDFTYNKRWNDNYHNYKAKDSFELRKNSYRVLLTRGRDGVIIFVPSERNLDETFNFLKNNGCKILN